MTAFAEGVVAAQGKIDILVAGVGGFAGGALLDTELETWKRMLDLNLTSVFSAYTVAKAGAIAFTQALSQETSGQGITVNAVLPSTMDTPANRAAMPGSDRKGWVPVEAVADAIAVLAREASAHITGTLLAI